MREVKYNRLQNFNRWAFIVLLTTTGIQPHIFNYASAAEATISNHNSDQPDIKGLIREATNLSSQGNYSAATPIWEQLLSISEKEFGPDHPIVAINLNNLAQLLQYQGKFGEAETLYRRSLAIRVKALGTDHPDVAQSLNNLAELFRIQKKYTIAESLFRQSLKIYEKALGGDHPDVALSLNNLAALLADEGKLPAAETLYRRSISIREKSLGINHPDLADSLGNLTILLKTKKEYAAAESLFRRCISIYEKALGREHLSVANALLNLADLLTEQGNYAVATPLIQRSLTIRLKALGPNHLDVATSLNSLALLLKQQGQYLASESLIRRSLSIRENALGPYHPAVAASVNNLAEILHIQGQKTAAETLYLRSLHTYEKVLGANHPVIATVLNNLAALMSEWGQYTQAEPLYNRALMINEQAFGPAHLAVALSLNNLGLLLNEQGLNAASETLLRRSLTIRENTLGKDHPDVAQSLNNLAKLLSDEGELAAAEPLYRRSLGIFEKALGLNHPTVGQILNNLAVLLYRQGRYAEAETFYRRSLTISEKSLGPDHVLVANALNNLSELLKENRQYSTAGRLSLRSLEIYKNTLGNEHPKVALNLSNLAVIYSIQGQYKNAITSLKQSIAIESHWLTRELPSRPDQARSAQLHQLGYAWEGTFSLIDRYPPAAQLALETRLNRQGLLPEIELRQALLLHAPGVDHDKVEQLQALSQELASVALLAERRSVVREQRDRLQAELYRQQPDLKIETVTTATVAKALPADGILVEFQRFRPFDGRKPKDQRWGKPQYIALILKPNGSISAVPLGLAAAIDATVHKGLSSSAEGLSDAEALWGQLSNQVMRPLLPHLRGSRQWFLSPDGELNRVPFAALPAPQQPSTPLAAAVQLRLLTTGRELVRLQQAAPAGSAAVVMANPSYDRHGGMDVAATQQDDAAALAQRRSADLGSNRWLPLPGTEREGQQVASLLGTRLISGSGATTTALQQQQGPRVLHVATHGFFVADQESEATDPLQTIQEQAPQLRAFRGEEPLLRSGLVLAGANQPDLDPKDDGYLTAAEALTLKLKGTELVVLSACSTAQGEIRTGEGVYGLQRALTVAGARSTLLSLWKVDDAATAEFMTRLYRRLKAGEGRADALAAVQQEFRDGKTGNDAWRSPTYWAAWQLVGDWRPIQGL